MKYAKIMENDTVNCMEGIVVSLFMSGCPHHCKNCFNQETWNLNFGTEIDIDELCDKLNDLINAYDVHRDFSLLGGEPLAEYNRKNTEYIINKIKNKNPNILIYVWSGYTLKELKSMNDSSIDYILSTIDYLIDGRYEDDKKDLKLKMRGSSNQNVYQRINGKLEKINI
jgi:anaerobic ribonucleoside-triphosphate reductase activating protein